METNVEFLPETLNYLEELVTKLYQMEYFSWLDTSQKYVVGLYDNIKTNLPIKSHKPAPPHFDRYGTGMYYASFRANRNTTWYAFFTKYLVNGETVYLVRYINNNHMIAQYL